MADGLLNWYKGELKKEGKDVSRFTDDQLTYELGRKIEGKYGAQKINEYPAFAKQYKKINNDLRAKRLGRDGFFGPIKEIGAGIGQGIDETQAMIQGGIGAGFKTVGLDSAGDYMMDAAMANLKESQVDAPTIQSYQDVTGIGDAVRYLSGGLGRVLPSGGTMLATGGVTGFAGKKFLEKSVVGPALRKALKDNATKSIAKEGLKKETFDQLSPDAQDIVKAYAYGVSQNVGVGTASGTMGIGEVYTSLYPYTQLDPQDKDYLTEGEALGTSWMFGTAIGSLDSILPSMVGKSVQRKFFKGKSPDAVDLAKADNFTKRSILTLTAKGMAVEAGTEATQEYLNVVADKFAHDEKSPFDLSQFTDQEIATMIDAGILGSIGGGVFGVAGGKIENWQTDRKVEQVTKEKAEKKRDAEKKVKDILEKLAGETDVVPTFTKGDSVFDVAEGKEYEFVSAKGEVAKVKDGEETKEVSIRNLTQAVKKQEEQAETTEETTEDVQDVVQSFQDDIPEKKSEWETTTRQLTSKDGTKKNIQKSTIRLYDDNGLPVELEVRFINGELQGVTEIFFFNEEDPNKKTGSQNLSISKSIEEKLLENLEEGLNMLVTNQGGRLFKTKDGYKKSEERRQGALKKVRSKQEKRAEVLAKFEEARNVQLELENDEGKVITITAPQARVLEIVGDSNYKQEISKDDYKTWVDEFYAPGQQPSKKEMSATYDQAFEARYPKLLKELQEIKDTAEEAKKTGTDKKEEDEIFLRNDVIADKKLKVGAKVTLNQRGRLQANSALGLDVDQARQEFEITEIDDQGFVKIKGGGVTLKQGVDPRNFNKFVEKTPPKPKVVNPEQTPLTPPEPVVEEIDGSELTEIPQPKEGKYVITLENGVNKPFEIKRDGNLMWASKGFEMEEGLTLADAIVQKFEKAGEGAKLYEIKSLSVPGAKNIGVTFDGIAINYDINSENKSQVISRKASENNGLWKYGTSDNKGETRIDTGTNQRQVQFIESAVFEDTPSVGSFTEKLDRLYGDKKKYDKSELALDPKPSGSTMVVAIRHNPSGTIIVRSIVNKEGEIYNISSRTKKGLDLRDSSINITYKELLGFENFTVLQIARFNAARGKFRDQFENISEYEAWLESIPKAKELEGVSGMTQSKLNDAYAAYKKYKEGLALTDNETKLLEDTFEYTLDDDGNAVFDKESDPVVSYSLRYFSSTTSKYGRLKVGEIIDQLPNESLQNAMTASQYYDKLPASNPDPNGDDKKSYSYYPKVTNILISAIKSLTDENGNQLIDNRSVKNFAELVLKAVYQSGKTDVIEEIKRGQGGISLDQSVEGQDGDSVSVIDTIPDEENVSHLEKQSPDMVDIPADQAEEIFKVFFPQGSREQLNILHQYAQGLSPDESDVGVLMDTNRNIKYSEDNPPASVQESMTPDALHYYGEQNGAEPYWAFLQWLSNFPKLPDALSKVIEQDANQDAIPTESDIDFQKEVLAEYNRLGKEIDIKNAVNQATRELAEVGYDIESNNLASLLEKAYFHALNTAQKRNVNYEVEDFIIQILDIFDKDTSSELTSRIMEAIEAEGNEIDTNANLRNLFSEVLGDELGDRFTAVFDSLSDSALEIFGSKAGGIVMFGNLTAGGSVFHLNISEFKEESIISGGANRDGGNVPLHNPINPALGSADLTPGGKFNGGEVDPLNESEEAVKVLSQENDNGPAMTKVFDISPEEMSEIKERNRAIIDEVLDGYDLGGAAALENINNEEFVSEEAEQFIEEIINVLDEGMKAALNEGRDIKVDVAELPQPRQQGITRAQFDPDTNIITIDPRFYLGEKDTSITPYEITGDRNRDILITAFIHEAWHATLDTPIDVHEKARDEGKTTKYAETYDLMQEVIKELSVLDKGNQYGLLNEDAVVESLNRIWTRPDFARWANKQRLSGELQKKIDAHTKTSSESILDALHALYIKLLELMGISIVEGNSFDSLIRLSKKMQEVHATTAETPEISTIEKYALDPIDADYLQATNEVYGEVKGIEESGTQARMRIMEEAISLDDDSVLDPLEERREKRAREIAKERVESESPERYYSGLNFPAPDLEFLEQESPEISLQDIKQGHKIIFVTGNRSKGRDDEGRDFILPENERTFTVTLVDKDDIYVTREPDPRLGGYGDNRFRREELADASGEFKIVSADQKPESAKFMSDSIRKDTVDRRQAIKMLGGLFAALNLKTTPSAPVAGKEIASAKDLGDLIKKSIAVHDMGYTDQYAFSDLIARLPQNAEGHSGNLIAFHEEVFKEINQRVDAVVKEFSDKIRELGADSDNISYQSARAERIARKDIANQVFTEIGLDTRTPTDSTLEVAGLTGEDRQIVSIDTALSGKDLSNITQKLIDENLPRLLKTVDEYINYDWDGLRNELRSEATFTPDSVRASTRTHIRLEADGDGYMVTNLEDKLVRLSLEEAKKIVRFKDNPSRVGRIKLKGDGSELTKTEEEGGKFVEYVRVIENGNDFWVKRDDIEAYDRRDTIKQMSDQLTFDFDKSEEQVEKEKKLAPEVVDTPKYTPQQLTAVVAKNISWGGDNDGIHRSIARKISNGTGIPYNRVLNEIYVLNRMHEDTPIRYRTKFMDEAERGYKRYYGRRKFMVDELDPNIEDRSDEIVGKKPVIEQNKRDTIRMEAASINEVSGVIAQAIQVVREKMGIEENITADSILKVLGVKGTRPGRRMQALLKLSGGDETMKTTTTGSMRNNENMYQEANERSLQKLDAIINNATKEKTGALELIKQNEEKIEENSEIKPDSSFIFNLAKTGDKLRKEIAKQLENTATALNNNEEYANDPILEAFEKLKGENESADIEQLERASKISGKYITDLIDKVINSDGDITLEKLYNNISLDIKDDRAVVLAAVLTSKAGIEQIAFRMLARSGNVNQKRTTIEKLVDIYKANEMQLAQIKRVVGSDEYRATYDVPFIKGANNPEYIIINEFIARREEIFKRQKQNKELAKRIQGIDALTSVVAQASERKKILLRHNPASYIMDGTEMPVMKKEGDEYVMDKITVRLNNSLKPADYEEFKKALIANRQYLMDPNLVKDQVDENGYALFGSTTYNYVKSMTLKGEALTVFREHEEAVRGLKTWWLKANPDLWKRFGTEGREIARMLISADVASREAMPRFRTGSKKYNRALLTAAREMGYVITNKTFGIPTQEVDINGFVDHVIDPLLKWNEDNPSFGSLTRKEFYAKAYDYAKNLIGDRQPSPEARNALYELLDNYDNMTTMLKQLGEKHGLYVQNDRRKVMNYFTGKMEPVSRAPIRRGYMTVPRKFKSGFVGHLVRKMANDKGWGDRDSELSKAQLTEYVSGNATDEEKNALMDQWIDTRIDEDILEEFIYPYVKNTSPRHLLTTVEGTAISTADMMDAWAKSEGRGAERFKSWIDVLYESLSHKKDRSDYTAFKLKVINAFNGRFFQMHSALELSGKANDNKAYAMAHALMDSRAQDAIIPIEFLEYQTFDEVSTVIQVEQIIGHAIYGRSGEKLNTMIDNLGNSLQGRVGKLGEEVKAVGGKMADGQEPILTQTQKNEIINNIGEEEFDSLIRAVRNWSNFTKAKDQLGKYLTSDGGPTRDEKFAFDALGTMAFLILQQVKSGLTNILSLGDQMVVYKGLNKYSIKATANSASNLMGQFFGGLLENLGVQLKGNEYAEQLMPTFFNTEENSVGFMDYTLNIGARGAKKASKLETFKLDGLRRLRQAMTYSPVSEGRRTAPVGLRTLFLHPFTYLSNLTNHSLAVSAARMVDGMVREVTAFLEANPNLPQDYEVTADDLGLKSGVTGSSKELFEFINNALEERTLGTITNLSRKYIDRKARGDMRVLTKDQVLAVGTIALHKVAMEGGFSSKPSFMYTNQIARAGAPLQAWSFAKVDQMMEQMRDQEKGNYQAAAMIRLLSTTAFWLVPVGMMFTFGMDEYDEEVLGKASALRPAPLSTAIPIFGPFMEGDPKGNALAMFERLGRAGNIGGVAFDFLANMMADIDPYNHNRGFSLDTRILAMAQILNLKDAVKNIIHSGTFDYQLVQRPLMYTMGMNGYLQTHQAITNLFDIDSDERRVSNMIGNRNKVRAALANLGIERAPMTGGSFRATRFSVQIRRMERAAYANDSEEFRDAYREAVEASAERGDEDPEKSVLQAFKRRNLRSGISKYKLSDDEWRKVQGVFTDEHASSLRHAMSMHEKFVNILESSSAVLPSPVMDSTSTNPVPFVAPISYNEIIRRSLQL